MDSTAARTSRPIVVDLRTAATQDQIARMQFGTMGIDARMHTHRHKRRLLVDESRARSEQLIQPDGVEHKLSELGRVKTQ